MITIYIKAYVNAYTAGFPHPMSEHPFFWGALHNGILENMELDSMIAGRTWVENNDPEALSNPFAIAA